MIITYAAIVFLLIKSHKMRFISRDSFSGERERLNNVSAWTNTAKHSYPRREPWSSGYGRRLMFRRLWVRIPSLYTGWTFFIFTCCKNCNVYKNEKEAGDALLKKVLTQNCRLRINFWNNIDMRSQGTWQVRTYLGTIFHQMNRC